MWALPFGDTKSPKRGPYRVSENTTLLTTEKHVCCPHSLSFTVTIYWMLMKCQGLGTKWSARPTTVANLRERRDLCGYVEGNCHYDQCCGREAPCYCGGSGLARKLRKGFPAEATTELRLEWRGGLWGPKGPEKVSPAQGENRVCRAGSRLIKREVSLAWQAGTLCAGITALSSHYWEALPVLFWVRGRCTE